MKNALLAILLLTPLLALLGTMAVNRRMAFFSDALGHSALAGVGLGMLLGVQSELLSMIVFGVLWAVMISRINRCVRSVITDKELVKEYLIMGKRGEHYSIGLAPEFIELPRAVTDE